MKSIWLAMCLLLVAGLVLSCAPQPAATPTPSPSAPVTPKPTTPGSPSPTVALPTAIQPQSGGTIRFFSSLVPAGYDLHRKPSYGPLFTLPIWNNLVRFDEQKPDVLPENIVGDLAEKWDTAADGKSFTFYLRKDVKWHDGTPFTADDVVYSVEKMVDPARSSIAGNLAAFSKIEKIDAYTVRISLKYPAAAFMTNLAGPYSIIEPKAKASVDSRTTDFLVGAGPFKFKSYITGSTWEAVKNPDYFKKGLPYLDGMTITIIPPAGTASADAFVTGKLDMTQPISGIANEETYQQYLSLAPKGTIYAPVKPGQGGACVWFNLSYGPFKDVRVRKAVALLVDPQQLTLAGSGDVRWGNYDVEFFGPGFGLPKADADKLVGRDLSFDARIAQAQKLMADAGYASGFKVKILSQNMSTYQKRAALLGDLLTRYLKIQVELAPMDQALAQKARDAGEYQLHIEQTLSTLGEPDELMPYFVTKGAQNWTGYSNPAVDKLWQDQTQEMDPAKRKQITQQIERTLLTDLPAVPIACLVTLLAWYPYVHYPVQNVSYCSNMSFEQTWMAKH